MALIVKEGTTGFDGTDDATQKMILEALQKNGYAVRAAEEDKTFVQKHIDDAFSVRNKQLEDTIKKVTGVDKTDQEKYYDYFERATATRVKEIDSLKAKISEYEQKGTDGNSLAQEYKKRVEVLEQQINGIKKEYDEKLSAKDKALFDTKVKTIVSNTIDKIKNSVSDTLAPEVLEDVIAARVHKFESEFVPKDVEGVIVFYDKSGSPVLSKKDGKPKSMDEIFTDLFAPYISEKQKAGAGSGKQQAQATQTGDTIVLPPTVTNKKQLVTFLENQVKLKADSKEFSEAFTKLGKDLPIGLG